jgi:hypothetical protein
LEDTPMRIKWPWVLVASLAIGAYGLAAAGMGTVGGKVVDAKGSPVADARVTLQASEGSHLQTAQSNQDGKFWFASLPEGQYAVRASDHDRISEWRQDVWVAPGKETDVVLHLHSPKPSSAH